MASAGAAFTAGISEREVPRDDPADDAERLARGVVQKLPGSRDGIVSPVSFVAQPA